jgi:hypothetical protein
MVGLTHVIVSPLIFILVYISYLLSGNRLLSNSYSPIIVGAILLSNLGFPYAGAFMCEVYIVLLVGGLAFVFFIMIFFLMGLIHINVYILIRRIGNTYIFNIWVLLVLVY